MITENGQKVNTENAVECQFGNAVKELVQQIIINWLNFRLILPLLLWLYPDLFH